MGATGDEREISGQVDKEQTRTNTPNLKLRNVLSGDNSSACRPAPVGGAQMQLVATGLGRRAAQLRRDRRPVGQPGDDSVGRNNPESGDGRAGLVRAK